MASKKEEAVGKEVDQGVGNLKAAALPGNVIPDVVQIGFDFRCKAVSHSAGR
jgi:hypothetical protein